MADKISDEFNFDEAEVVERLRKRAAEKFPPSIYIRRAMEARGWSESDLARKMRKSVDEIGWLLDGTTPISQATARLLAEAFETSDEVWLNLQNSYSGKR